MYGKAAPYGKGKGFGAPYGKGKGKSMGPKVEKPMVNPAQINPTKEPFDGGISFKNMLQEKISKQIHRPISPGDLAYAVVRVKGGKTCTLTFPGLPEHADKTYESDGAGKDEKQAGQMAASKALEELFPEVYLGAMEAHSAGIGAPPHPVSTPAAAAPADGGVTAVDPYGEPKGWLNRQVQLVCGRPLAKEDVVYETTWKPELGGYICVLKLNGIDEGTGLCVYESDAPTKDQKQAEKSAARIAIEANKETFEAAKALHDSKKAVAGANNKGFGKGKSFGKNFGKSFGKGKPAQAFGNPYGVNMGSGIM